MEVFSFYDHAGISRHLEKMAAKGWMIERMSNFGWVYHRIDPKPVKFAVSYYPKASEFDPEPTDEQKTFHEFCAHTGWKLACTSAQLQIFYNEQENLPELEKALSGAGTPEHPRICKKEFHSVLSSPAANLNYVRRLICQWDAR